MMLTKNNMKTKYDTCSELTKSTFSDRIKLSVREIEIIKLIAAGYSNKEIAKTLYVSTHTIKSNIEHILRMLNARNRANSVFLAIEKNIIDCNNTKLSGK